MTEHNYRRVDVSARLFDGERVYLTASWQGAAYIDITPHSHPMSAVDCVNVWDYKAGKISDDHANLLSRDSREQYNAIAEIVREWAAHYTTSEYETLKEVAGIR